MSRCGTELLVRLGEGKLHGQFILHCRFDSFFESSDQLLLDKNYSESTKKAVICNCLHHTAEVVWPHPLTITRSHVAW